jgi:hypothetical protein
VVSEGLLAVHDSLSNALSCHDSGLGVKRLRSILLPKYGNTAANHITHATGTMGVDVVVLGKIDLA